MASLVVSAEFVRPGLVGGAEQALHYSLDGLVQALDRGDELTVVGNQLDLPRGPLVRLIAPTREVSPRFLQESLSYRSLARDHDAYFFPNYFTPPGRLPCRTVTTIPDLQYLHFPANFSRRKRAWLRLAHNSTLRRADAVTVYSRFVLEDIACRYGESTADRVTVMPIPVSWERFGSEPSRRQRPYVLSAASHYAHKNLATLIRAFEVVHAKYPDLQLVLTGQLSEHLVGVSRTEDVRSLIAELGLEDAAVVTGYIDVNELGALYRGAELFVFPSIFEGFGLPPVEALGFGLPVITTRRASLEEVTLGMAEYVDDAHDVSELSDRIVARLERPSRPDDELADSVRAHYSPTRIGAQLYELMTSGRT